MVANPPHPDPPPAAAALHRRAVIDWPYTFTATDSLGRHVKCWVPVHARRVCKVVRR